MSDTQLEIIEMLIDRVYTTASALRTLWILFLLFILTVIGLCVSISITTKANSDRLTVLEQGLLRGVEE